MTTLQSINTEIIGGDFTDADLNSIQDAIRFRRGRLVSKNVGTLVLGTMVKFTNSRTGILTVGKVKKVARKFIHVDTGSMIWRVPANMLDRA